MNKRLASLDVLRGIDMFLLAVVGPFVWCLNKVVTLPDPVLQQIEQVNDLSISTGAGSLSGT